MIPESSDIHKHEKICFTKSLLDAPEHVCARIEEIETALDGQLDPFTRARLAQELESEFQLSELLGSILTLSDTRAREAFEDQELCNELHEPTGDQTNIAALIEVASIAAEVASLGDEFLSDAAREHLEQTLEAACPNCITSAFIQLAQPTH